VNPDEEDQIQIRLDHMRIKMTTAFSDIAAFDGMIMTGMDLTRQNDATATAAFTAIHRQNQGALMLDFEERARRPTTWDDLFQREEGRVR